MFVVNIFDWKNVETLKKTSFDSPCQNALTNVVENVSDDLFFRPVIFFKTQYLRTAVMAAIVANKASKVIGSTTPLQH